MIRGNKSLPWLVIVVLALGVVTCPCAADPMSTAQSGHAHHAPDAGAGCGDHDDEDNCCNAVAAVSTDVLFGPETTVAPKTPVLLSAPMWHDPGAPPPGALVWTPAAAPVTTASPVARHDQLLN